MAKPGIVLRRPVGSTAPVSENSELPTDLSGSNKAAKTVGKASTGYKGRGQKKAFVTSERAVDRAAERKAALAYEREEQRRGRERAKEETTRQKERERRKQAVEKAQAALDKTKDEHAKRAGVIQAEIETFDEKLKTENARWQKDERRLEAALRRARVIRPFNCDLLSSLHLLNSPTASVSARAVATGQVAERARAL